MRAAGRAELMHMQQRASTLTDVDEPSVRFTKYLTIYHTIFWSLSYILHHTHTFNGPLSGTTRVSRYQKGTTNLDFTEARDSEWQWHQLGRIQVCTSLQTDNHASTTPLSFLQTGCPSCRPTNSVKALKGCIFARTVAVLIFWSSVYTVAARQT